MDRWRSALPIRAIRCMAFHRDALQCTQPLTHHSLQHAYVGELVTFAALHPGGRRVRCRSAMSYNVQRKSVPACAPRDASMVTPVSGVKTPETQQCLRRSMATADRSAGRLVCFMSMLGATSEFLRKLVTNCGFRSGARRAYSVPPRRTHAGVLRR